jgi:hypothetical protein
MILLCTLLPENICEREHFCHKLERIKPRRQPNMYRILWWFEGKKKERKLKIYTAQLLDSNAYSMKF